MSDRKPVWKQRVTFSKDRNISCVVWPKGEYQGHPTPPSITLEEGKRQGESWVNTRITLTLDKAPNVIQNLQIAYAKALELQSEQPETEAEVAQRETAKPTDPVGYLKMVILEAMKPDTLYPRMKLAEFAKVDEWVEDIHIEQAINGLLEDGRIRPKFEALNLVAFTKA